MSYMNQWCSMCKAGATKEVTHTHHWCTNCGCVFDENGVCRGIPTKLGPDPVERREAWDHYAAAAPARHGHMEDSPAEKRAAAYADAMLAERDARFCPGVKT